MLYFFKVKLCYADAMLLSVYLYRYARSGPGSSRPADPDERSCAGGVGGGESRRLVPQLSDQRSQRHLTPRDSHTAPAAAGELQVSLVYLTV